MQMAQASFSGTTSFRLASSLIMTGSKCFVIIMFWSINLELAMYKWLYRKCLNSMWLLCYHSYTTINTVNNNDFDQILYIEILKPFTVRYKSMRTINVLSPEIFSMYC